ncbi:phasin family protein, partial [Mesorhizobium sp. M1C.F.Ca.ET.212.01.1.1]
EKLFAAKSIEKAIEIQTDYAKQSYEGLTRCCRRPRWAS